MKILEAFTNLFFTISLNEQKKFPKIIAFGDSSSDTGRMWKITTLAHSVDDSIPISPLCPPMNQGRQTDDLVFSEYLAQKFNLNFESDKEFENWAIAACSNGDGISWDPTTQQLFKLQNSIDQFIVYKNVKQYSSILLNGKNNDQIGGQTGDELQIMWVGINDFWGDQWDSTINQEKIEDVADMQRKELQKLINNGARNLVVMGIANAALVPDIRRTTKPCMKFINKYIKLANDGLQNNITKLINENTDKDLKFYWINTREIMNNEYFSGKQEDKQLISPCICCNEAYAPLECDFSVRFDLSKEDMNQDNQDNDCTWQNVMAFEIKQFAKKSLENFPNIFKSNTKNNPKPVNPKIPEYCSVCSLKDQDKQLFTDKDHPSHIIHKLLADEIYNMIQNEDQVKV